MNEKEFGKCPQWFQTYPSFWGFTSLTFRESPCSHYAYVRIGIEWHTEEKQLAMLSQQKRQRTAPKPLAIDRAFHLRWAVGYPFHSLGPGAPPKKWVAKLRGLGSGLGRPNLSQASVPAHSNLIYYVYLCYVFVFFSPSTPFSPPCVCLSVCTHHTHIYLLYK